MLLMIALKDYSRFLDDEFDAKAWVNNAFRSNKEGSNDVSNTVFHVYIVDYKHFGFGHVSIVTMVMSLCHFRCPKKVVSVTSNSIRYRLQGKEKGKEEYLYSTIYTMHSLKVLRHGSQFCLQITTCLPFFHKRSPDGATLNWDRRHPIEAYYSLIDPKGMKGWVGLVGWFIADAVYPHKWSPISYRSSAGQGSLPAKDRCNQARNRHT